MTGILTIKHDRIKPIRNQHPWVFSGAVDATDGDPAPGDIVTLVDPKGRFLARGYYNPKSQIVVRILTWQDEPIDNKWWRNALERAVNSRAKYNVWAQDPDGDPPAYRVINAENDYLPGLIVDRYGDWLVLQALTLGVDIHKMQLAAHLADLLGVKGVYERSDVDVRRKEGLQETTGVLWGEAPPPRIEIGEYGSRVLVDPYRGHKTGFYLDQRPNRQQIYDLISEDFGFPDGDCKVLNLFSYSGGFALKALQAGQSHATSVDSSREALELAEENLRLNGFDESAYELIQANVFDYLRDMRDAGQQFDIVILDPPKFAQNAQQVDKAARGYKDLNLNAFHCIKPGGYLMTFSCSGAISRDLFQKIVFGALADSGRQAQILKRLGPGDDHPVALTFPEGDYLKGLLLRVY